MNHVTFETAKMLKEAGFPQTGHAYPQLHYWKRPGSDRANIVLTEAEAEAIEGPHEVCYAPTATELLPEGHGLRNAKYRWEVWDLKSIELVSAYTNPAEAAAEAWLYLNAKNS